MADNSKIEWTDATWNPIRARLTRDVGAKKAGTVGWHCERITTGCGTPKEGGCYAEAFNHRLGTGLPFKPGYLDDGTIELFLDDNILRQPLRWKRPRMVFPCSMTDLFGRFVKDEWLDKIFAIMALTPQHIYQPLTKRSDRMRAYFEGRRNHFGRCSAALMEISHSLSESDHEDACDILDLADLPDGRPQSNVWLGVSTERQEEADARIPDLLATPAAVRFISAEPLLGPIDLAAIRSLDEDREIRWNALTAEAWVENSDSASAYSNESDGVTKLDWVIVGGESGPHARPMHPDWARSLRDQCQAAGIPYFFKQWGELLPVGQVLPGFGKVHGATAVQPGRMKLHYGGSRNELPKHAYAETGVTFASIDDLLTFRVGKKAAGRLLDGVEHNGMPERQA